VSRPLAWLAGQRVVLTPVYRIREGDAMGWGAQIPRSREFLRALDSAIAGELAQRGLEKQWVYPADLARSMRASPTYTVDPNALAVEPLRNPGLAQGGKIGDPLATQLRTIVAMHDSRMVLLPVELRFDRDKTGQGIAILRAVLVDALVLLSRTKWQDGLKLLQAVLPELDATHKPTALAAIDIASSVVDPSKPASAPADTTPELLAAAFAVFRCPYAHIGCYHRR